MIHSLSDQSLTNANVLTTGLRKCGAI